MPLLHESREAASDATFDSPMSQSAALFTSSNNSKSKNRWNKNQNRNNSKNNSHGNNMEPQANYDRILGNAPALQPPVAFGHTTAGTSPSHQHPYHTHQLHLSLLPFASSQQSLLHPPSQFHLAQLQPMQALGL